MITFSTHLYPKSRFLEGLAPAECKQVLAATSQRTYLAHSVITYQGEPADYMFLLTRGRARYFFLTEDGKKIQLASIAPGDVFGTAAMLPGVVGYLVSVEMVTNGSVSVWRRRAIQEFTKRYPRLYENTFSIAAHYLEWALAAHLTLIGKTARQRIAQALLALAAEIGEEVPGGFSVAATNDELANAANITPFTASRLLSELQRSGAITRRRGKVTIRSRERLREASTSEPMALPARKSS